MRRNLAALAIAALVVVNACAGETTAGTAAEPSGSVGPSPSPSPTATALAMVDAAGELCLHVGEMEARLQDFLAVELTLTNRTSLEVELDKLQAAYDELDRTDLGAREDELGDSLKRLGYRMGELKLAVDDFKTNAKPKRAVPHVEEDSRKVSNELNAFVILSRC